MSEGSIQISVVTPVFNRRDCVAESVTSSLRFLQETGLRGEIVIVDDASTDGSAEHLESLFCDAIRQGLIRLHRFERNGGVTAAKQAGAETSRGEWLVFMDSDDAFTERAGMDVATALQGAPSDCPVVFFRCIDDRTRELIGNECRQILDLSAVRLLREGTPGECLPVARRAMLLAEPYDADLRGFEFLAYARMARRFGPVRVMPVVARSYCSAEDSDRLSTRKAIRRRGCLLARGYGRKVRFFWRELGFGIAPELIRAVYHGANCTFIRLQSLAFRAGFYPREKRS